MKEKIVFCWSGGKDSALAPNRLQRHGRCRCDGLPFVPPGAAPGSDCPCPVCLAQAIERVHAEKS